jgi:hypothetical protein
MSSCIAIVGLFTRQGRPEDIRVCGKPATGFVAPGEPRCGHHLTARERAAALARRRAVAEMRALRDVPSQRDDEEPEHDDPPTDSSPEFDVSGFVDATLDEA